MVKYKESKETYVNRFRKSMLKKFKINFKFTKFRSKHSKHFISKIIDDELITLFEYTYNFIKCRFCNKWSRASLDSHRKCMACTTNTRRTKTGICVDWAAWCVKPLYKRRTVTGLD